MNFTELSSSVRPEIIRATQAMGYTEMTEIQQKAIPLMLAGHDMIAKAPTGTGKTCRRSAWCACTAVPGWKSSRNS